MKQLILIVLLSIMIIGSLSLIGCTTPNQNDSNNNTLSPPTFPEDGGTKNNNTENTLSPPALPE